LPISSTFYEQLLRQKLQSQTVARKKLRKTVLNEKATRKMLTLHTNLKDCGAERTKI